MANYYQILGLTSKATSSEIRKAYRFLARQVHPDLNPGDKQAGARFNEINEAYQVLSDTEKRKGYDQYGPKWKERQNSKSQGAYRPSERDFRWHNYETFTGLGDFPGNVKARRRRKANVETAYDLSLEEAYSGTQVKLSFTHRGLNRKIEVTIPPGVDTGSIVKVTPADTLEVRIKITVLPHALFKRTETDLHIEAKVPLITTLLGGTVNIDTLADRINLSVPAECQNGQTLILHGKGMPKLGDPDRKGNLHVTMRPVMPKNLTVQEKKLIEELSQLRPVQEQD